MAHGLAMRAHASGALATAAALAVGSLWWIRRRRPVPSSPIRAESTVTIRMRGRHVGMVPCKDHTVAWLRNYLWEQHRLEPDRTLSVKGRVLDDDAALLRDVVGPSGIVAVQPTWNIPILEPRLFDDEETTTEALYCDLQAETYGTPNSWTRAFARWWFGVLKRV